MMELILSSISAGGLAGAANQYMCLLLISIAGKTNLIELTPEMQFMESWWFIGIVALFWVLTAAPAYGSLLSPTIMKAINTVVEFLSTFAVPVSAALIGLASVGIITAMHPDLRIILESLQLFGAEGGIGTTGIVVAGGSAVVASTLTGSRILAKPAFKAASGTPASISAPLYATIENVTAVILMLLLYAVNLISPWMIVVLIGIVILLSLAILTYAVYQLWKLGKDVGQIIHLIETQPKHGLSVVAEFLVWGLGWMLVHKNWNRGIFRIIVWALWLLTLFLIMPALTTFLTTALAVIPFLVPVVPVLGVALEILIVIAGLQIGLRSARGLLKTMQDQETEPCAQPVGQPAV